MTFQRRCHVKLRFSFGNVHLFLVNDEVPAWREALSRAFDAKRRPALDRAPRVNAPAPAETTPKRGAKVEQPKVTSKKVAPKQQG